MTESASNPTPFGAEQSPVRTRFAPSPTGFLHIGGARTALFAWAYARHFGGQFILRIEDTDLERSTPEAVQAILDGMQWLGLDHDEGPFYQTQRGDRYREVIAQLLASGAAYPCYCSTDELNDMREAQRAAGQKPRYDGRWRPENSVGKTVPEGVPPVVRFRNPDDGAVLWTDLVKGPISINNAELDDLIIARADGSPTYNFCVVVDDWDMGITDVIRGDDHVNNTPRQINILNALGAPLPNYGHVPMIHGSDGQKLSKRHGAVSVINYHDDGYLAEAVVNYLARLGWSHGDDELFDREQLVAWFDGSHLSQSPSQFDTEKLNWVNQHYLKQADNLDLAQAVAPRLGLRLAATDGGAQLEGSLDLAEICGLLKERSATLEALADACMMFFGQPDPQAGDNAKQMAKRFGPESAKALADFALRIVTIDWTADDINATIKSCVADNGIKMAQFGVPLRVLVFGQTQTPSLDQVLLMLPMKVVQQRLHDGLENLITGDV